MKDRHTNIWFLGILTLCALFLTGCNPFNPYKAAGETGLKLYWADTTGNTYCKDVSATSSPTANYDPLASSNNGPFDYMAIDPFNHKLYYCNATTIYCCNIDKPPYQKQLVGSHSEGITGLAVDGEAGKLYYFGKAGAVSYIYYVSLGGDFVPVQINPSPLTGVYDLQLDTITHTFYWIEQEDYINSALLVGNSLLNMRTVLNCASLAIVGDAHVKRITLSLLEQSIYIYLYDKLGSNSAYFLKGSMNASAGEPVVIGYLFNVSDGYTIGDIDLDPFKKLLYYTYNKDITDHGVKVCDLNSTSTYLFTQASTKLADTNLNAGLVLDQWPNLTP